MGTCQTIGVMQIELINFNACMFHCRYLPTDVEKQKRIEQWQAGGMLVYNTKEAYTNFLHWAYLCALTADCIAPVDALKCRFKGNTFRIRAGCHRYDQAMVNLLLSNWHGSVGAYTAGSHRNQLFDVVRHPSNKYQVQYCKSTTTGKYKQHWFWFFWNK